MGSSSAAIRGKQGAAHLRTDRGIYTVSSLQSFIPIGYATGALSPLGTPLSGVRGQCHLSPDTACTSNQTPVRPRVPERDGGTPYVIITLKIISVRSGSGWVRTLILLYIYAPATPTLHPYDINTHLSVSQQSTRLLQSAHPGARCRSPPPQPQPHTPQCTDRDTQAVSTEYCSLMSVCRTRSHISHMSLSSE